MKISAVLAFLCALTCALPACRTQPSATVFLDPALAVLVPADTTFLAGIRMQRLRKTPFYENVRKSNRFIEFQRNIGIADDSDIWEFLIASNRTQWIALLRGKFTEMGMEPRVRKPSARRELHQGVPVFGDEKGAIAFLNPTTAIAGQLDAVVRALELRNSNAGVPEDLRKLTQQIPANNEAWFVSTGPAPGFLRVERLLSGLGGFDPQRQIAFARVEAETAKEARTVAESLSGVTTGNKVSAEGKPPAEVIDWMLNP